MTKEGTNETSDMEALFGPKEGEEDTRLSAQAWKRTQQRGGTDSTPPMQIIQDRGNGMM